MLYQSFPATTGKCSHGGPSDAYKDVVATGGINKETSDPELSPHYHLHQVAGRAAVQATYDLLVGEGETTVFLYIWLPSVLGFDSNPQLLHMKLTTET